jgi:outer membrane immunogenic protein
MIAIKNRHLRSIFISASTTFLSISVLAAPYNWQGPYLGAFLGGAFSSNDLTSNVSPATDVSYFLTPADVTAVNNSGTSSDDPSTWIVGLQGGHDWVWKQMVYGVALDYSTLSLRSSSSVNNKVYPDNLAQYSINTSMSTDWLFTLRGRLGYQTLFHCPTLLYITGGMAITQLKVSNSFGDNSAFAGTGGSENSENQIGWTAGAGIEYALSNHISADLSYLYVGIPSVETTASITNAQGGFGIPVQSMTSSFTSTADFHTNLVKLGFNYRFDE